MQMRHIIGSYALEKGRADKVVEIIKRDEKTYVRVNDHEKLRGIFGELSKEVQRIKSEGDFEAARALVEKYGVIVDKDLVTEVRARVAHLNIASAAGFVQPRLKPVTDSGGDIVDVLLEVPDSFYEQMLEFGREYSTLPTEN